MFSIKSFRSSSDDIRHAQRITFRQLSSLEQVLRVFARGSGSWSCQRRFSSKFDKHTAGLPNGSARAFASWSSRWRSCHKTDTQRDASRCECADGLSDSSRAWTFCDRCGIQRVLHRCGSARAATSDPMSRMSLHRPYRRRDVCSACPASTYAASEQLPPSIPCHIDDRWICVVRRWNQGSDSCWARRWEVRPAPSRLWVPRCGRCPMRRATPRRTAIKKNFFIWGNMENENCGLIRVILCNS